LEGAASIGGALTGWARWASTLVLTNDNLWREISYRIIENKFNKTELANRKEK